jgi:hypothetical protein
MAASAQAAEGLEPRGNWRKPRQIRSEQGEVASSQCVLGIVIGMVGGGARIPNPGVKKAISV